MARVKVHLMLACGVTAPATHLNLQFNLSKLAKNADLPYLSVSFIIDCVEFAKLTKKYQSTSLSQSIIAPRGFFVCPKIVNLFVARGNFNDVYRNTRMGFGFALQKISLSKP